VTAQLKLLLIF